jgi:hypothetical protein
MASSTEKDGKIDSPPREITEAGPLPASQGQERLRDRKVMWQTVIYFAS